MSINNKKRKSNKKNQNNDSDSNGEESRLNSKKSQDEWKCLDCNKAYKSYPAFYTHNKLKHQGQPPKNYDIPRSLEDIRKDRGRPRVTDTNQRIKFAQQDKQQQRCEDNLYEYLGKLGQKGDESGQKENNIIRGYLQKPINCIECFPLDYFANDTKLSDMAQKVKTEIYLLEEELKKNSQWEFVDPLDLKPDDLSEFSIYNLKALFYNLAQLKMTNKNTTLTVFLVWLSRELLEDVYKDISVICLNYINQYQDLIDKCIDKYGSGDQFQEQLRKERHEFKDNFQGQLGDYFSKIIVLKETSEINEFLDRFVQWYHHFDDDNWFDNVERITDDELVSDHEQESLADLDNSKSIENKQSNGQDPTHIQISQNQQANENDLPKSEN